MSDALDVVFFDPATKQLDIILWSAWRAQGDPVKWLRNNFAVTFDEHICPGATVRDVSLKEAALIRDFLEAQLDIHVVFHQVHSPGLWMPRPCATHAKSAKSESKTVQVPGVMSGVPKVLDLVLATAKKSISRP